MICIYSKVVYIIITFGVIFVKQNTILLSYYFPIFKNYEYLSTIKKTELQIVALLNIYFSLMNEKR